MRKKETAGSSESSCGNVWSWMHRFVGVPVCFVLVLLAVVITNGQAMADGDYPVDIDGTGYAYGENQTYTGTDLEVTQYIEHRGTGSADLTVKSINTSSGVDAPYNTKAAVYAHDGGKTYIRRSSDSNGNITITGSNIQVQGAYVSGDATEVLLDVNTITANSTAGSVTGVTVYRGGKLTVTNADTISAVSSSGSAYGVSASQSADVSLDVNTITANSSTNSAEGVSVSEGSKLTVTNADTISAVSSGGSANGVKTNDANTEVSLDVKKTITAKGKTTTWGVYGGGGTLTVTNAKAISADSSTGKAYGAYSTATGTTVSITGSESEQTSITAKGATDSYGVQAQRGGTANLTNVANITATGSGTKYGVNANHHYSYDSESGLGKEYGGGTVNLNNVSNITASGAGTNYGVWVNGGANGGESVINLNNVGMVTANGGTTNYSAYVSNDSTLNVSTDATTTFNGNIYNAGTINGENMIVNGGIENNGGSVDITVQSIITDSGVDAGDGKAAVYAHNGGTTHIGGNGTITAAISGDKIGYGVYASDTSTDVTLDVKAITASSGSSSDYGIDVKSGAKLTVNNAEVISADSSNGYAYGALASDTSTDVTLDVKAITAKGEKTAYGVFGGDGGTLTVTNAEAISADSSNSKAYGAYAYDGATVSITGSESKPTSIAATGTTNSYGVYAKTGSTINLTNVDAVTASGDGTNYSAYVNDSTSTLNVSTDTTTTFNGNIYNAGTINGENMIVNGGIDNNGTIKLINSYADVDTLSTGTNGTLYIDPSYMQAASVSGDTLSGNTYVGSGSVLNLGNMEGLQDMATEAGFTTTAGPLGFTVAENQALLAANGNYTLAADAKLIVDSAVAADGTDANNTTSADVYFGNNSLFAIDGSKATDTAVLTLSNQKLAVDGGAKLSIANAETGQSYKIFTGASQPDVAGWQGSNLLMSKLLLTDVDWSGGELKIVTRGYDLSSFADTIPYNSILAMADLRLVSADADLETSAGIRFLSRATDTNYLDAAAIKPTLNEVSTISTTAAIQHAALRATDAMTDAVAEHMSTTLRVNDSEIHDGDTTDVWATPFYRSMSWSGGGNDADGYMSGFSFGIDKHAGKNARYGLAMHYGTGSTDSDGAKTDTTNSSKAIGVSLYGSKQWGKLNVMGQIGYTDYDNTMSSYLPSTMNMPTITASPNASTFTADVRAERAYKSGTIDITPHAGVRYTRVMSDSFKTYLSETQSDSQNIVQFPVGVTFGVQRNAADGWKLKGLLDLAVVPVAGNKDAHTSVLFTGINNVWNDADTAILDSCSFRGSIGFTAERNYFSSNLGYALQTSSNETNHTFRLWLNWKLK